MKAECDGETAVDLEFYNHDGNDESCTRKLSGQSANGGGTTIGDVKVKTGECFSADLDGDDVVYRYRMDVSMSLDAAAEDVAQGLLGIIIGIVVAVICCILCCCAMCWYMAKQNKAQNTVVVQQVPVAK